MKLTKTMIERQRTIGGVWIDMGNGFGRLDSMDLCYVSLPPDHKDCNKDYDSFDIEVNGGLTFGCENVYGWDYCHAFNDMNVEEHFKNALEFFKSHQKRKNKMETLIDILKEWYKIAETGKHISLSYDTNCTEKAIHITLFHHNNFNNALGNESGYVFKSYSDGKVANDDGNLFSCLQYLQSINGIDECHQCHVGLNKDGKCSSCEQDHADYVRKTMKEGSHAGSDMRHSDLTINNIK